MKKGKKFVAMLLCFCMISTLMVGLSPIYGATSEQTTKSENTASEQTATDETAEEEDKQNTPPRSLIAA